MVPEYCGMTVTNFRVKRLLLQRLTDGRSSLIIITGRQTAFRKPKNSGMTSNQVSNQKNKK